MECKTTSTNKRSRAGMTLIEMLMSVAVGSLVIAGVTSSSVFTSRDFVAIGNYCDMNTAGRYTLEQMAADIRQADFLSSYTTNALVFQTTDPTTGSTNVSYLTYTYNPAQQTLTRSLGLQGSIATTNTMLLTNITYFRFDLYQRNPQMTNGGDLVPLISTSQPNLVKAVDLSWICSRFVVGVIRNSDDVQSARVVIRKN